MKQMLLFRILICINKELLEFELPENIVSCKDFNSEKVEHMKIIDFLYDSIIRTCLTASNESIPHTVKSESSKKAGLPG